MGKNGSVYEFDAVILKHDDMDAAYVEFPFDVEKEFGTKGQVKVKLLFDEMEYRGSLAKIGLPGHCIGLTKAIRSAIGKVPGDTVHVVLQRDDEPRTVEVPDDLAELLENNKEAGQVFSGLSYTHRKEYVTWIESAKKEETRVARLQKSLEMLLKDVKHP